MIDKTKAFKYLGRMTLILVILIIGWGLLRACSSNSVNLADKVYRLARDPLWSSWQLMDRETALLAFSDDLVEAIVDSQHLKVDLYSTRAAHLFEGLDEGFYDVIFATLAPDDGPQESYMFSEPFYLLGPVLIVQASSPIKSLHDLQDKMIGVSSGNIPDFRLNGYPEHLLISYDNMVKALSDLNQGSLDAVVMRMVPAYVYTTGFFAGRLKVVGRPLNNEGLRAITLRSQEGAFFIEAFNRGLKELKDQKMYDHMLAKWGLFNPEITEK